MKQIIIDRWSGAEEVSKENWKDLISAFCLAGYEVYADEGKIVFTLGDGDIVQDIKEN